MSHMNSLRIINASVLDIATGTILPGRTIAIRDGLIAEVSDSAVTGELFPGEELLDVAGKIVMPGLIDGHVHVMAGTADLGGLSSWSPNYAAAQSARLMKDMLHRGFTTVRDVAGADYGLAQAVEEGLFVGPRVVFGGKALSQTGGHGDMRGPGSSFQDDHQCCPSISIICDGADAVRKGARDQLRTGANHVKIMLSGGVASPTDRVDSTQFSDEEIVAVVEEARAVNRYVTGHAYTARAVNRGLKLGVRCIEHGNLIDDESVALFVENNAYLVPTLITYQRLKIDGVKNGLSESSHEKVDLVLNAGLEALARATRGGVNVVFGTDLLGDMQQHQSEEFSVRAQVQSSWEILRSATLTAAELMGMEGQVGVIAPGAFADLLVLNKNPLDDVTVLSEPETSIDLILKAGHVVDR
ncbi:metal-dependent hydrolase family protein [Salinibacterium sp. PAMC 21357]|uniref:metal-dependent hydrolase family protein n=1 Tax=Salinibacterium sp. PAMC 21357 TaxID=1112215 RepID=UPI000288F3A7|nr:amidohydrolase family protein [Salinibacterium sp. PAMC 21357]